VREPVKDKTRVKRYKYGVWAIISEELDNRIVKYIEKQKVKGGLYTRSSFTRDAIIYFLNDKELSEDK